MKKITLVAAILIIGASLTSCKKDYTCTCTDPGFDNDYYYFKDVKKKDAKNACNTWSALYSSTGGSCSL